MQISRRDALRGAGAVAVAVAGVPTSALAIKAASVKAALAGEPDARIFALVEEHDRTLAAHNKAGGRWYEAVMEKMPPHLSHVEVLNHKEPLQMEAWDAISEICEYPEVKALSVVEDRLKERCHDLKRQLSQTEAMTLQGVCAKFRIANPLRYRTDDDLGDSAVADVEHLAGEVRS